jgi:hypothetical protein
MVALGACRHLQVDLPFGCPSRRLIALHAIESTEIERSDGAMRLAGLRQFLTVVPRDRVRKPSCPPTSSRVDRDHLDRHRDHPDRTMVISRSACHCGYRQLERSTVLIVAARIPQTPPLIALASQNTHPGAFQCRHLQSYAPRWRSSMACSGPGFPCRSRSWLSDINSPPTSEPAGGRG